MIKANVGFPSGVHIDFEQVCKQGDELELHECFGSALRGNSICSSNTKKIFVELISPSEGASELFSLIRWLRNVKAKRSLIRLWKSPRNDQKRTASGFQPPVVLNSKQVGNYADD